MIAETDLREYLDEIREQVCSRCVERPEGGPPCTPLGKVCGVELHLPQLVAAVQEVHSPRIAPYLDNSREKVCKACPYLHQDCCPCPMDSLAVLVVESIEEVEERRRRRQRGRLLIEGLPPAEEPGIEAVARAYEAATGRWTGCDWPTAFGADRLDLKGLTSADAESLAVETDGLPEGECWASAARWLEVVEGRARQAEREAALALAAANAGSWEEAVRHAHQAWALEFHTGRPLRHAAPTWQPLYRIVAATAREQG